MDYEMPRRIPSTLRDRLAWAWRGWRTLEKDNPDYWPERERHRKELLDQLPEQLSEPLLKGNATTATSAVAAEFIGIIEAWPLKDQVEVLKAVCYHNMELVRLPAIQEWAMKHSAALAAAAK